MSLARNLRLTTYLACAITFPLNIAALVLSLRYQRSRWARRHVTAFCFTFIPLALTITASTLWLLYVKKHKREPRAPGYRVLDLVSALGYIGVLIPCWALEIREFNAGGFGLLVGYTTIGMLANTFIHVYFVFTGLSFSFKTLISHAFGSTKETNSCQQCPNCNAKFVPATAQITNGSGYSLLQGEDYLDIQRDPIQYRDSEDFLGVSGEEAGQAGQAGRAGRAEVAKDRQSVE